MFDSSSHVTVPFPPSGSFLKAIRDSSRSVRLENNINISPESIQRLLHSPAFTDSFKRVSSNHGLALPLNFPSPLAELNLLSILSILNFASGYRVPLHAATGRGAWDTIRALVFSMYLTSSVGDGDLLSARGMKSISFTQVAELMGVSVHTERPHELIPGVQVGELGGPLYELTKLVETVLNETGEILVSRGYPDLGTFIVECLEAGAKHHNSEDKDAEIEVVLERIVRAIPGFQDMFLVNNRPIYCFKKALFLLHAISIRFGSKSPSPFPVPSTNNIPVFTDNVLPSMLIHLGVIDLSSSPSLSHVFTGAGSEDSVSSLLAAASDIKKTQGFPTDGPVLTTSHAYILRAAAIDACELIVEIAQREEESLLKDICLPDLDMWLWAVAKDRDDYRKLPRFVLRNTVFF